MALYRVRTRSNLAAIGVRDTLRSVPQSTDYAVNSTKWIEGDDANTVVPNRTKDVM